MTDPGPRKEDAGRRPERIAVLGGTFDPVHLGHIAMAEGALAEDVADRVVMVPASVPSFKQGSVQASFADRLAMCEAAVAGKEGITVSDMEGRREGVSYTVDTVRALKEGMGDVDVVFLIGSDAAASLPEWDRADELAREASFHVFDRTASGLDRDALIARLAEAGFDVGISDASIPDVSSTDVREAIQHGERPEDMLDPEVAGYIMDHGLYGADRNEDPSERGPEEGA